jgi:hypothetical protein
MLLVWLAAATTVRRRLLLVAFHTQRPVCNLAQHEVVQLAVQDKAKETCARQGKNMSAIRITVVA